VMERRRVARDALLQWAATTPFLQAAWRRFDATGGESPARWGDRLLDELIAQGALGRDGADVVDR